MVILDGKKAKIEMLKKLKERLKASGYTLLGAEPLKLTVDAKAYGYAGTQLA